MFHVVLLRLAADADEVLRARRWLCVLKRLLLLEFVNHDGANGRLVWLLARFLEVQVLVAVFRPHFSFERRAPGKRFCFDDSTTVNKRERWWGKLKPLR